jgi:hypothetical protein
LVDVISYLKKSFLIFSNLLGGGQNKDKNKLFFYYFWSILYSGRPAKTLKIKFYLFSIFGFYPGGGCHDDVSSHQGVYLQKNKQVIKGIHLIMPPLNVVE